LRRNLPSVSRELRRNGVKPMISRCRAVWLCLGACLATGVSPALARTAGDVALQCDVAAEQAARSTGVPAAVLMAIARVETGRTVGGVLAPWPWTVNEGGDGAWFDTADQALSHVKDAMASGGTNIDIGCFQVNLRWHGGAFSSLDDMFDPFRNALYAAQFLQNLFAEFGTWDGAVGAYHSRKSDAAYGYLKKVADVLDLPSASASVPNRVAEIARDNRYPLLQGGGGGNGSLFSATAPGAQPLLR
jgi:hypothetical protein